MKSRVIALEEHYFDPEVTKHFPPDAGPETRQSALGERAEVLGAAALVLAGAPGVLARRLG